MPHPTLDTLVNQTCRVCGDRLSAPIRRGGVSKVYRRHFSNRDCTETKGRGEPIQPRR